MRVRPHGAPKSAPTFGDLVHGGLFLKDGELCVKCQDLNRRWAGFMFMDNGGLFEGVPESYAPAPGEWVVSNEEMA